MITDHESFFPVNDRGEDTAAYTVPETLETNFDLDLETQLKLRKLGATLIKPILSSAA